MHFLHCPLPLPHIETARTSASNQNTFCDVSLRTVTCKTCTGNVRLMRRSKDKDSNRFALSGKLADVCAALDALAEQEMRNTWRVAAH